VSGGEHNTREHAVVIGAGIAGLCAARVLSQFYSRVTVDERDEVPDTPANRATARGAIEFDGLFPGLLRTSAPRAACSAWGRPCATQFTAYVPSRPLPDWQLRRRVRDSANVEIVGRRVAEPRCDPARPARGAATTSWTASRAASSRSATQSPASTPPSGRA